MARMATVEANAQPTWLYRDRSLDLRSNVQFANNGKLEPGDVCVIVAAYVDTPAMRVKSP